LTDEKLEYVGFFACWLESWFLPAPGEIPVRYLVYAFRLLELVTKPEVQLQSRRDFIGDSSDEYFQPRFPGSWPFRPALESGMRARAGIR
jgi:hypothetical protein